MPEPIVPEVKYTVDNMPKSKTEWDTLKSQDPVVFADLTQHNFDKMFREKKELEERYTTVETQRNNLTVELERYKVPVYTPPIEVTPNSKNYSFSNLPKTKQDWEDLMIEDPVLGTDLRTHYNNQQNQNQQSKVQNQRRFEEAQTASRRTVQAEHPDMYLAELDATGQPKKDDKGNVVLKVNPATGEPEFNPESEKGKLWNSIFNENPDIAFNSKAPELMMATMERKLRMKGQTMVDQTAAARQQAVAEGQVIHSGVTPPKTVKVEFSSEEEKIHAQNMIAKGVYPTLEDYVRNRDSKDTGFYEENSFPKFTKK